MEQAPNPEQQVAPERRLALGRLCGEAGKEGHQPGVRQGEESALESRCGKEKSAQRRAGDLAYAGRGVEAPQLDAARPRQLARHRPGRRPERGPRQDQRELARHQHPEPMGEHEPDAGDDGRPARTQHDAPSADAVGVGAAGEVERHLRQDRRREQAHRSRHWTTLRPGRTAVAPASSCRGRNSTRARRGKKLMRHGTLWVARL